MNTVNLSTTPVNSPNWFSNLWNQHPLTVVWSVLVLLFIIVVIVLLVVYRGNGGGSASSPAMPLSPAVVRPTAMRSGLVVGEEKRRPLPTTSGLNAPFVIG